MKKLGMFVAIEGPDGVGKSVLAKALTEGLVRQGLQVTATREPGGTALAESLRQILLSPDLPHDSLTQALLFTAGRRDHVNQVIRPALCTPGVVIVDRYLLSTLVYQGVAGGTPIETLLELHDRAVGLLPDLILQIDLPTDVILERLLARRKDEQGGINESRDRAGIDGRRAAFRSALQALVEWSSSKVPAPSRLDTVRLDNSGSLESTKEQALASVHHSANRSDVRIR